MCQNLDSIHRSLFTARTLDSQNLGSSDGIWLRREVFGTLHKQNEGREGKWAPQFCAGGLVAMAYNVKDFVRRHGLQRNDLYSARGSSEVG